MHKKLTKEKLAYNKEKIMSKINFSLELETCFLLDWHIVKKGPVTI